MSKLLKAALKYHATGYKVVFTNSQKRPAIKGGWTKYRTEQTEEDIKNLYEQNKADIHGLAVLCTDGMEVIDIDQKYSLDGQLTSDYLSALTAQLGEEEFFNSVTIATTTSGGAHLIYKTNIPAGNQKLASREATSEEGAGVRVLLETRGIGGYICVAPTPGYAFDVFNGEFAPMVSDEWRNIFVNTAKTFDEIGTHHTTKAKQPTPPNVQGPHLTTIEAFNENHTPYELLEGAGWVLGYSKGENDYLVRPGKTRRQGIGASYNNPMKLAYFFTSSSEFDCNKAYNAFQVYSVLNHRGDYKEAARALYRSGYGDRISKTQDSETTKTKAILSDNADNFGKAVKLDDMQRMYTELRFSIEKKPKFVDYCLTYRDQAGEVYNVGAYGDIITITGAAKSRKSALGSSMVASAIGGNEVLNFTLKNEQRDIVYIDTEQTEAEHYKVQSRVYRQAKVSRDPANYFAFTVGEESRVNMVAFIAYIVKKHKNIGVLFIDGMVDLCEDYNDLKGSSELVSFIKKLANKHNIMVINVLHNARSTGDARGHLGTELINKSKAVIQVTKDQESQDSTVNFKYLRERSPNDFDFTHDSNGNLILV